jgi:hypothetical protein
MKFKNILFILIITVLFSCKSEQAGKSEEEFPVLKGQYIGQKMPGLEPEIFAPGIISSGKNELNAVFSPDFSEFYFSTWLQNGQIVILVMKNENNQWTKPEVVSFSGKYSDADPFITHDNKWLYFASKRPVDSSQTINDDNDIWRSERLDNGWGEPERLDSTVNSEFSELYPTLTNDGTLYFSSGRDNASGGRDIFYSKWRDNKFQQAEKLDDVINNFKEGDVFVSPDEDYLIFSSNGRKEGNGLFISFKENDNWTTPQFMKEKINATGREYCPMVTPDGKYFFYASPKNTLKPCSETKLTVDDINKMWSMLENGQGDIYWIDAKIINEFRIRK